MAVIVGFSGAIGAGKSTAARILVEKHGFIPYSFAAPIKEIMRILGFKKHQVSGTQEQKLEKHAVFGVSGRRFMQEFGTKVMQEALPEALEVKWDTSIWVMLFTQFCKKNVGKNIVIDDVRFPKEVDAIKSLGGVIFHLERNRDHEPTSPVTMHASETQELARDVHVINASIAIMKVLIDQFVEYGIGGFAKVLDYRKPTLLRTSS